MCTRCARSALSPSGASRWLYVDEGQLIDVVRFDHLDGERVVVGEPEVEDWVERHEEVEGLTFCFHPTPTLTRTRSRALEREPRVDRPVCACRVELRGLTC
jgi:hypothetical protein